jgi:hypothetical protein
MVGIRENDLRMSRPFSPMEMKLAGEMGSGIHREQMERLANDSFNLSDLHPKAKEVVRQAVFCAPAEAGTTPGHSG